MNEQLRVGLSKEIWGGGFLEGKTSNVELDVIYTRYLPRGSVLHCDEMVHLNRQRAKTLESKVREMGTVYFPIFIRCHWIAGILTTKVGKEKHIRLETYDSAFSPLVWGELCEFLHSVWPSLLVTRCPSPKQRRDSNDCGIFMSAQFFRHLLSVEIQDPHSLPQRLRPLLQEAKVSNMPLKVFLTRVRKAITNGATPTEEKQIATPVKASAPLYGGVSGNAAKSRAKARQTVLHRQRTRLTRNEGPNEEQETARTTEGPTTEAGTTQQRSSRRNASLPARSTGTANTQGARRRRAVDDATILRAIEALNEEEEEEVEPVSEPPSSIDANISMVLTKAATSEEHVVRNGLDYMWAATALASIGDGVERSLAPPSLGMQRKRLHFQLGTHYSVEETIRSLGKMVYEWNGDLDANGVPSFCKEEPYVTSSVREEGEALYVSLRPSAGDEAIASLPRRVLIPTQQQQPGSGQERGALLGMRVDTTGYRFLAGCHLKRRRGDSGAGVCYSLTKDNGVATFGVYFPATFRVYPPCARQRLRSTRRVPVAPPCPSSPTQQRTPQREGAREDPLTAAEPSDAPHTTTTGATTATTTHTDTPTGRENEEEAASGQTRRNRRRSRDEPVDEEEGHTDEAAAALEKGVVPLNEWGRSPCGAAICPRNWFIYPGKPQHVSQVAWNAVTRSTRDTHRRWLETVRSMPYELLSANIATACLELVRAHARARKWKWSTTCKAYSSISGALAQLPLYTNQTQPIRLMDYPEWRQAMAAAQRYEREMVTVPPEPITAEQVQQVHRTLDKANPQAGLFLEMMWTFSARAGDILTLQCRDVKIEGERYHHTQRGSGTSTAEALAATMGSTAAPQQQEPMVAVTLTMRRGKGARFRGPYPVASVLTRKYASLLQQLLNARRGTGQRVFTREEDLRSLTLTHLRKANERAALPSVRKGSLRHLAANGIPETELMRLSGHTKVSTLRRYLGYGTQLTVEAERARANVGQVLHGHRPPQTTS